MIQKNYPGLAAEEKLAAARLANFFLQENNREYRDDYDQRYLGESSGSSSSSGGGVRPYIKQGGGIGIGVRVAPLTYWTPSGLKKGY